MHFLPGCLGLLACLLAAFLCYFASQLESSYEISAALARAGKLARRGGALLCSESRRKARHSPAPANGVQCFFESAVLVLQLLHVSLQ